MSANSDNQQAIYKTKKEYIRYIHLEITTKMLCNMYKDSMSQVLKELPGLHVYMALMRTSAGIWEHAPQKNSLKIEF